MKKELEVFISYKKYSFSPKNQEILEKILKIVSNGNYYLVNLFLIGRRKSRQLNHHYRKIDKYTDVLAFPFYYSYKEEINFSKFTSCDLGDIFICYPLAGKQARQKKNFFGKRNLLFIPPWFVTPIRLWSRRKKRKKSNVCSAR